jgi:hypothetical protein
VLTARDTDVLRHVANFGVLSTDQACHLCFPSVSRARKRLKQLWQHRLLRRSTRPVHVGDGTSPYLYSLAPKGKERVTAKGNGVDTVPTVRVRS